MNLLPFLLDGAQTVAEQLRLLNPASHAGIAEHWVKVFRPAYGQIKKIVCWHPDGSFSGVIESNFAVKVLEEAFEIVRIKPESAAATTSPEVRTVTEKEMRAMQAAAGGEPNKDPQGKPTAAKVIDLGAIPNLWPIQQEAGRRALFGVAPSPVAVADYGIPEDAVTLRVRGDGTGRLRIYEGNKADLERSKVRDMDGATAVLRGQEIPNLRWRRNVRRITGELTAEQVAAILG